MNASALPRTSPPRTAPLALWRVAEAFMHVLYNLFGAPEDVAAKHTLMREAHERLASWLRCAEALLRRLIAIEAAAYPQSQTPPPRATRRRVRKAMGFDADKPEEWRVTFRCLVSSPACGGSVSAQSAMTMGASAAPSVASGDTSPARGGGNRFRSAWPLAERYEALIRVFNNPAPYAKRLAARLHCAPARLDDLLRAPEDATHRIHELPALTQAVQDVWSPNSS